MKLNDQITQMLFELSDIESADNTQLLIGDGGFLRDNLLTLYRRTDNTESHHLISKIMEEGGYPLCESAAKPANDPFTQPHRYQSPPPQPLLAGNDAALHKMSEDEFLDLLPANSHFH